MKHLKVYEQFNNNDIEKLKEFCNDYLAYLLDEGFRIKVEPKFRESKYFTDNTNKQAQKLTISIYRVLDNPVRTVRFSWEQIKDYFIPFLHVLNDNYIISDRPNSWTPIRISDTTYSVEDILENDNLSYFFIPEIVITITSKN